MLFDRVATDNSEWRTQSVLYIDKYRFNAAAFPRKRLDNQTISEGYVGRYCEQIAERGRPEVVGRLRRSEIKAGGASRE